MPVAKKKKATDVATKRQLARELTETVKVKQMKLLERDFYAFFKKSWEVMEPGTPFIDSWHYRLLSEYLTIVGNGDFRKRFPGKKGIIFNVPPRTSKSNMVNVSFPDWVWTTRPEKRFMCISYGKDLATPLSVKRRDLIQSEWYQGMWPKVHPKDDANLKTRFDNDQQGMMAGGTPEGTITGLGGNYIIIDDILKADDAYSEVTRKRTNEFYENSLSSRLNNPAEDVFIIICQCLHEQDIVGYLMEKEPEAWLRVVIPMEAEEDEVYVFPISKEVYHRPKGDTLCPERFTKDWIAQEKKRSRVWAGQYQQRPAPAEGYIFQPEWFEEHFYDATKPPDPSFQIISVDCAFKGKKENDLVAIHCYGIEGPNRWLLDRDTSHKSYVQTIEAIKRMKEKHPKVAVILVEEAANGYAVIKQLGEEFSGVIGVQAEGKKEARAHAASADVESGNVFLPDPDQVGWTRKLIENFCSYNGEGSVTYDDDIDAFTQCINWVRRRGMGVVGFYDKLAKEAAESRITSSGTFKEAQRPVEKIAQSELMKPARAKEERTCSVCHSTAITLQPDNSWTCNKCAAFGHGRDVTVTGMRF